MAHESTTCRYNKIIKLSFHFSSINFMLNFAIGQRPESTEKRIAKVQKETSFAHLKIKFLKMQIFNK